MIFHPYLLCLRARTLTVPHLLEKHALTSQMMNIINDTLEQRGLLLKGGTMVDATIIHAPPSTKNPERKRDPEMHQTKKGNLHLRAQQVRSNEDSLRNQSSLDHHLGCQRAEGCWVTTDGDNPRNPFTPGPAHRYLTPSEGRSAGKAASRP
jgi:hypothetical protein